MKILSKKFLAVLLAGMMLLPLAACAETEDDPENTKASTDSNTEVDTSNQDYVCDLPDDLDFKNATVTLLYVKSDGRSDEMPSEKLGLGTISDAVYERNVAVENQLNVKLSFVEEVDDATASSSLKTMVQAGDKSVELSTIGTYFALGNAIEGCQIDQRLIFCRRDHGSCGALRRLQYPMGDIFRPSCRTLCGGIKILSDFPLKKP